MMRQISLLLALVGAVACGKDDGKSAKAGASADQTVAELCAPPAAALADDADGLRHVPATALRVVQGSTVRSMCDLMKDSAHSLAVFQFTSVTCVPCMEWAHKLNTDLVAKGFGDPVLSVMVVTDPIGMLSADDERRLKRDVAPGATWVYDDFQDLWKFFSPGDPGALAPAVTPLYVAMDPTQRGFSAADASGDAAALVAKANSVLGLAITAKTATP